MRLSLFILSYLGLDQYQFQEIADMGYQVPSCLGTKSPSFDSIHCHLDISYNFANHTPRLSNQVPVKAQAYFNSFP